MAAPTDATGPHAAPAADRAALRDRAEAVLRALAGEAARLREDQWTAIEALVADRRRALVVQRTGWGKSAVYFVATALLREAAAGPTLIVSPLLALMRNQVEAAERAGIRARTINSANLEEWSGIEDEVRAGQVDVLLVSPERLNAVGFREEVLPALAARAGLVVVDEAHCISDWGHDFRPDYRRLRDVLAGLRPDVPVLATTATANERVTRDVAEQLGSRADGTPPLVLRGSLDRPSLRLGVLRLPTAAHRLAWLTEHLRDLPGSGIVYCLTVAQADDVAAHLRAHDYPVASYSGRTEAADRAAAEQDLLENRVKALVATSALGMGFDKPDLGFVVHVGAPQSPVAYYQQVGRAGRAVERADVLLLPGPEDEEVWRWFDSVAFPPEPVVRRALEVLAQADKPLSTAALEPLVELNRTRMEQLLKVLDVDGAVRRVRGGWAATGTDWTYDAERYARVSQARARERQAMRDYVAGGGCRMAFLRSQLDDVDVAPCGRCDECAGPFVPTGVSDTAAQEGRAQTRRPGVELAPRAMWPTGLGVIGVPLSGRIPAGEAAEPGRAVGRLSDIGWGPRLREVLGPGPDAVLAGAPAPADIEVPDDLVAAVVEVLRAWGWERRPAGVVAVPSRTRPRLVASLAERIATIGRLPLLGQLERSGAPESAVARTNSAQRVRALHAALEVPPALAAELPRLDGPVLLVDDVWVTGWTATLAARALRRAGAPAVLPLVLAQEA